MYNDMDYGYKCMNCCGGQLRVEVRESAEYQISVQAYSRYEDRRQV